MLTTTCQTIAASRRFIGTRCPLGVLVAVCLSGLAHALCHSALHVPVSHLPSPHMRPPDPGSEHYAPPDSSTALRRHCPGPMEPSLPICILQCRAAWLGHYFHAQAEHTEWLRHYFHVQAGRARASTV
ncbi:hypothetical protein PMIN03_009929 [Paraphaeosphaeria minitans]